MRAILLALICAVAIGFAGTPLLGQDKESSDDAEATRGLKKPAAASALTRYPKAWALVIGVDYAERMDVERIHLPKLSNAQRDAQLVQQTLSKLYGFDVQTLLGEAATKEAVAQALESFNNPAKQIGPDDAVLVYFSGHGARVDDVDERGVIYPFDIEIQQGRPVGRSLRLHSDLVNVLKNCPAKHKLIVLDCCHSGEIFNRIARPFSDNLITEQTDVLLQPTFQAIASCRSSQLAADGARGENSPFTASLVRSLQRLPAREIDGASSPVTASRLFVSMRADLKSLRNGQSPDCRRLEGVDGEFMFWPAAGADFSPYRNSPEDYALLQAMVPGEYGKWWFDETPWFIPSLRRVILENTDAQRASADSSAIDRGTLLRVAEAAVRQMEKSDDLLTKLRVKQFNVLTAQDDPRKFREEVSKLADELTKLRAGSTSMELDATDVHLLGVLEHFLSMSETNTVATVQSGSGSHASRAEAAYAEAIDLYESAEAKSVALAALCHCDLGNLLLLKNRDWTRAAREFEYALSPFCRDAETAMAPAEERSATRSVRGNTDAVQTRETPAAFQIYVYCQQADAWQRQNRWGEADRCLDSALAVAQDFAPDHSLTSFVHARRAWSAMEQWQIRRAAESFSASNRVLANLARDVNKADAADVKPALDEARSAEFADLVRYDYDAAINYLHNEHGLAMTQRFEGHVKESAATYRAIIDRLSLALRQYTSQRSATNAELSADVEARLFDRLVNTQERLGDCNLFGDPDLRDIKEAADDYRRAIELCSALAADRRDQRKASLLFRQALALSIPSAIQDPEHARFLCADAEALLKQDQGQKSSALVTLSVLTPALVSVFESGSALESLATTERLSALRTAIADANSKGGRSLHRDQLEVLLFAARVLVDQGEGIERFQAARDADLLLSLCRQTLTRAQTADSAASPDGTEVVRGESLRYLRPYYDSVMRRKLALTPKHVKELLEVQFEATQGELYVKPKEANPILAVYVLDGKGWMFLDIPRGVSKHVTLDGHCLITDLEKACNPSEKKLPLPADIFKELAGLAGSPGASNGSPPEAAIVDCRCHDHVRGLTGLRPSAPLASAENSAATVPALVTNPVTTVLVDPAPTRGSFPFVLPNGVAAAPNNR